jgi:hypothetical protein
MAEKRPRGALERFAGFAERLNYALGALAVGAAVIFPEAATPLIVFGVLQFAEGAVWKWLKDRRTRKLNLQAAT